MKTEKLKIVMKFIDIFQGIIAFGAGVVLILDEFELTDSLLKKVDLVHILFIAVCAMIVSSVLERRFILKSFHDKTDVHLDELGNNVNRVADSLSGYISGDIFLKDRSQYGSIRDQTENAAEVYVAGKSLIGFVNMYRQDIMRAAEKGCSWKIVIQDPTMVPQDARLVDDIRGAVNTLKGLQIAYPDKIFLKFSRRIYNSVIAIDYKFSNGKIQVELYANAKGILARPHFNLIPNKDPKWYKHYEEGLDKLWEQSKSQNLDTLFDG